MNVTGWQNRVTSGPLFQRASSFHRGGSGGAFFLLALFAGMLGGVMGLPFLHVHPSAGVVVSHAVLMTFYVVAPVFLGGMAQWFLPDLLKGEGMALPSATRIGFGVLAVGAFLLPVMPYGGLALWSIGVLALAFNVVATVLEMRSISFRSFPPLVWAFLANALSMLVIAPVLLAFLLRGGLANAGPDALLSVLRGPVEMTLLSVPSLGIIIAALLPEQTEQGWVPRCAPYAFGVMGLVPVLFWADHLFGDLPSSAYKASLTVGLVLPCLALLVAFARDLWRAALPSGPAAGWASGGLVLLLAGWAAMLTEPLWAGGSVQPAAFMLGAAGHQLVMFGSLLALSAAFYGWCGARLASHGRFFAAFGMAHTLVTFVGALCSVLPQLVMPATLLMGGSLLMFALPAGMVWYGMLVERTQEVTGLLRKQ
ncbi:hypothetical protein CPA57_02675 [Bombella sp. TMW2.1880]|uniref:Cytochrome oxidase subunit I profile domain-containing protein n=1 Tax=Bombella favorum TaxID=2039164 RepID=A0ABR5ZLK5_9PROT|nr:hypothetical protein [Bombella favorum]